MSAPNVLGLDHVVLRVPDTARLAELIGARAAAAMAHTGRQEQPIELLNPCKRRGVRCLALSCHHGLVPSH